MVRYCLLTIYFCNLIFSNEILCDFKVKNIQETLQIATLKKDSQRIKSLHEQIKKLKHHCSNTMILQESLEYIQELQQQLASLRAELTEAKLEKNMDHIKSLSLEIELLHTQLIAAKQEQLQLKDMLKK